MVEVIQDDLTGITDSSQQPRVAADDHRATAPVAGIKTIRSQSCHPERSEGFVIISGSHSVEMVRDVSLRST
jgi:hypothetical protein